MKQQQLLLLLLLLLLYVNLLWLPRKLLHAM
jgi:hypothetical protein